jgi:hypothetical protein
MVTSHKWKKAKLKFDIDVQNTARERKVADVTYKQFAHLTHRSEVQNYLRLVWQG